MAAAQKELIRHEARARRASIPGPSRLKAAEALATHIASLTKKLSLADGATVGCYLAIGTEINTSPLLRILQRSGYQVALPRTSIPAAPLDFVKWQTNEPLKQDVLGFPAPAGDALVEPDALIVPLVAFDRDGGRIGQGAGLYDRTLLQLRRRNPYLPVIGLAFACQEMSDLPLEPHDQRLNYILTETGVIDVLPLSLPKELDRQGARL